MPNLPDTPQRIARIGRGGKLHPYTLWPPSPQLVFLCSCPLTRNGRGRITWTGIGVPTCRRANASPPSPLGSQGHTTRSAP